MRHYTQMSDQGKLCPYCSQFVRRQLSLCIEMCCREGPQRAQRTEDDGEVRDCREGNIKEIKGHYGG